MKRNSFEVKKMIRAAVLSLGILTAAGFTAAPADIVCVAEAASSVSLNKNQRYTGSQEKYNTEAERC